MTQKDKIRQAIIFVMKVKSIASDIKSEGDDYDMQWHKGYCKQLADACEDILKTLR